MSEHMVTLERDPGPASLDTSACTTAQHSNKTHLPNQPHTHSSTDTQVTTPTYTFPHRLEVVFQVLPSYRVRQVAHIDSPGHLDLAPALCIANNHLHDCHNPQAKLYKFGMQSSPGFGTALVAGDRVLALLLPMPNSAAFALYSIAASRSERGSLSAYIRESANPPRRLADR